MAWKSYGNKFNNKKIKVNGITFDSKLEANRYVELKTLENAGMISELALQQKFTLIPAQYAESTETYKKGAKKGELKEGKLLERACIYVADFTYINNVSGELIVEDTKGMKTPEYIIKRKLMLWVHGIRVKEVKRC